MPTVNISVNVADQAPMSAVLEIVFEMLEDDRIPVTYKARLGLALMGSIKKE